MERHHVVTAFAPYIHQRIVQRMKLVHFAHRILKRGDVHHALVGRLLLRDLLWGHLDEWTGPPFLPCAQATVPQIDEGLISALDGFELKAICRGLDVAAVPLLDECGDAVARLPWRTRQPPGKE